MKHWHGSTDIGAGHTTVGTVIVSTFAVVDDPTTLLRTLGEVTAGFADQTLTAGDKARVTIGLGIVSADAVAVGATAMPDPASEPEYDWLWWRPITLFSFGAPTAGSTEVFAGGEGFARIEVSSKAMRKMKPKQTLVLLSEYSDLSGTPAVDVQAGLRFLFGT